MIRLPIALVVASLIATAVGGLSWGLYIATLGVALGTLGLAYFTWSLAVTTHAAVEAAQEEMALAERGVVAATQSADEARRTRVDSLAPLMNISVLFVEAQYKAPSAPWSAFPPNVEGGDAVAGSALRSADVQARFQLEIFNYGRTPGYLKFTDQVGLYVEGAERMITVPPGECQVLRATVYWNGRSNQAGPEEPLSLVLRARAWGPMTQKVRDEIRWEGVLTLIRDFHGLGGGFQMEPEPLEQIEVGIKRIHGSGA